MKYLITILAILFYSQSAICQIKKKPTQLKALLFPAVQEIEYNNFNMALGMKNSNPSSGTIMGLFNDMDVGFTFGVNASNPLLNPTSANNVFLSTNSDNVMQFMVHDTTVVFITKEDVNLSSGTNFVLQSPDNTQRMGMATEDDGGLYFFRNNDETKTILFLDDDDGKVGVNIVVPKTEMTIRQTKAPVFNGPNNGITNIAGLTLENSTGQDATFVMDTNGHLSLSFESIYRGWWNQGTGAYTSFSDKRLKKEFRVLNNVLPRIMKIQPSSYVYKSDPNKDRVLGFIAQNVEEHFPEIVSEKDGYKALTYDDFSVLAIRAIQEQQELITKLEKRIAALEQK